MTLDLQEARRSNAKRYALELLQKYREDPALREMSQDDIYRLLTHRDGGPQGCSASRIMEIKYLLQAQNELSIMAIADCVGIRGSNLGLLRLRDPELDQMVRDYQANFFEEEAMTGSKGLHPALTIFGLKARAGWVDAKDRSITVDQLAALAEQFMQVIREELEEHPDLVERIATRLSGQPLRAKVESIQ